MTWNSTEEEKNSKVVVIKQHEIQKVMPFWNSIHNTTPTDKELELLLKNYIQNEILYREALEKNLDHDDENIKNILIDKLKYRISDSVNITEVSPSVLEEYFNANRSQFTNGSQLTLTFGHIYLNPQEHQSIDTTAKKLLNEVKNLTYEKHIHQKGDKFYAGNYFENLTKIELSKSFSRSFVNELAKLPENQWSLLKSGFGIHLIYMVDFTTRELKFDDVKKRVKEHYILEKNRNAYKEFYRDIKEQYTIIIENNNTYGNP